MADKCTCDLWGPATCPTCTYPVNFEAYAALLQEVPDVKEPSRLEVWWWLFLFIAGFLYGALFWSLAT